MRDIEAPAHNPEDAAIRLFALKAVVQKVEIILALAVRDHFGSAKARHQAGRLQFNAESATSKTTTGARDQKTNQPGGHRSGGGCLGATRPLTTGQETKQNLTDRRHQVPLQLLEHFHVEVESIVGFLNDPIRHRLIDGQRIHG